MLKTEIMSSENESQINTELKTFRNYLNFTFVFLPTMFSIAWDVGASFSPVAFDVGASFSPVAFDVGASLSSEAVKRLLFKLDNSI